MGWGPGSQQALDSRLDKARERALRVPARSSLARFAAPLATAAAVALLAVILVEPVQHQETPSESRLVNNAGTGDVPELYEELDFYLWLADHKANTGDSAT